MRVQCRDLALGWLLVAFFACSDSELRPTMSGDCNEPGCTGIPRNPTVGSGAPGGSAGTGGAGGEGGAGGAGGSSGMPPPPVGSLVGSVRMIADLDLLGSGNPDAPVEIRAPGATDTEVVGTPNTDGSFRLDGILTQSVTWVAVGTFADPPSLPFMDTLQVVDTAAAEAVNLVVVRRSVMEEIAQEAFLVNPIELDPARGHALIRFVDEIGNPISGLRLIFPTPDNVGIAYDLGDIYSDSQEETSVRGTVVLLNIAASRYPGVLTNVVVEHSTLPTRQFRPNVRVATGSVTVLEVELELDP